MRRFNRGYALIFLVILIVSLLAVRWTYQRVEGAYQARINTLVDYTLDDWLDVFGLDAWLGDPPVTPLPFELVPATSTPSPPAE